MSRIDLAVLALIAGGCALVVAAWYLEANEPRLSNPLPPPCACAAHVSPGE